MKRFLKSLALGILLALPWVGAASAQQVNLYCQVSAGPPQVWGPCNNGNPLSVNASVSASITGFPTTQTTGTPISVTTSSGAGTLPSGAVVVASNVGATNGAYCKLGATATTSDQLIPPNSWFAFTVGSATQLACITSTSTTTVNMVGGSGLPTGSGGGGEGSGGAVTNAGTFAVQVTADSTAAALLSAVQAPIPAQSDAIPIGGVGICDGGNGATNPCTTAATVKVASTAAAAADKALVVGLSPNGATPALGSQYPFGATAITASATGTTAATTATLAGTGGKTTYICSLSVRANATANTNVTNTVTGVITGTLSRAMWVPANTAGLGVDEQIYNPCVPASATNTGIAIVSGAPGTGGVVTVNATGYQL